MPRWAARSLWPLSRTHRCPVQIRWNLRAALPERRAQGRARPPSERLVGLGPSDCSGLSARLRGAVTCRFISSPQTSDEQRPSFPR
jgi:hypothetical protein